MEHSTLTAEDFWNFSIEVYARKPVQSTCLQCQDQYGADVNLLLLGVWLNSRGTLVSEATLDTLLQTSHHWQSSRLSPIRQRRRAMAKGSEKYRTLLSEELQLEKEEQKALLAVLHEMPTDDPRPANLFSRYAEHLKLPATISAILLQAVAK